MNKGTEKLNKKLEELNNKDLSQNQHQKGKLTAKERINLLLDENSFTEFDSLVESRFSDFEMDKKKLPGDAVISGFGKISGRSVYVYSQDFSKMGGSLGEMHGEKIARVIDSALKTGCPIIGIIDSGGARIQEGIASLDGYAKIFKSMVRASGVIPQISVMVGPSAGGASYAPGLSDFIFMVQGISQMYITGPEVIKKVSGEEIGFEELGGAQVHATKSGCAHFVFENEKDCFSGVKKLLSYLPQNNLEDPLGQKNYLTWTKGEEGREKLSEIVPEEQEKVYDMKLVIEEIFDRNSFFEIHSRFASNAVVGLARLSGNVVGIVANQTKFLAGVLDIDSSDKVARFVRFCDAFNLPVINLVDTPGYLPGTSQEHQGIIRHGAKILYAYAEASVPKISLILRKAFGGAYIALASRYLGYDKVIAWPGAQIAVMGAEQAVKIIYKKQIAENPNLEKEKIEELKKKFLNPFEAAKLGQIDLIIDPKETRLVLIKCLDSLLNKREERIPKKHGNIPT
ncbi:MAG: acyl-CoA carboxylase subunit beta [Candidatus Paceibacterota bacterium]|jgi:acetyl-CoA carboxylase carboxyltransferase component|nr:acyl-CoA carboxylase subunit beta [Candidatus Paceibacterota bacterium]MDD5555291.1 acyl-CoA carboxylase subunit beta [Candidatus Paceibacterota bacterium]